MWFPIVPIYLACLAPEPWPPGALGQLTHACVVAITTVLAALQLVSVALFAARVPRIPAATHKQRT